ncbi:DUF3145 domain-containing protein [Timonella senegalensis]|uniref:DUF3145 domain-containing protein n=1 Tax=Timonella senegalensis TaxID=1465825 RepID=UPI0002D41134|nr:DUF3145 domain-containing protein [Timonella senegalensis]
MKDVLTRGVFFVHSAPRAMCPHVEWAITNVLGVPSRFDWIEQPAAPGLVRTEFSWQGKQGSGSKIVSSLRGWDQLRFEVTEDPSFGVDGSRWSHTPSLGIFHANIDVHGNVMVPEGRVRSALEHSHDAYRMRRELDLALGTAWDEELEPFRYAGEGAPVRWLHQVG